MVWQDRVLIIVLVGAAAIAVIGVVYLWQRRPRARVSATGMLLLVLCAGWLVSHALYVASSDPVASAWWDRVQYVGVVLGPTVWSIYVLQYTGLRRRLAPRTLILVSALPLILALLTLTNDVHGLMWRDVAADDPGVFGDQAKVFGVGFWTHIMYTSILSLLASFELIRMVFRSRHLRRWQAGALLFAAVIPWLPGMLGVLGWHRASLDVAPLALIASALIIAWSVFQLRLGDVVPVAREAVIETMDDAVIVLDAQGRVVDLNPATLRLIGRPLAEAIGRPVAAILPGWSALQADPDVDTAGREMAFHDRIMEWRLSPLYDRQGDLTGLIIVLRNVTQRKRAEQALQQLNAELEERVNVRTAELEREQAQLRAILEGVGEGVIYSEGAATRYVNRALSAMTGYEIEELLDQPFSLLQDDTEDTREFRRLPDDTGKMIVWREETRLRRKDGSEFEAALTSAFLEGTVGGSVREVMLIRDISQEKALRAQKDRFIAHASHELRTPLTTIKTRLWLARRQPDRMAAHLDALENSADELVRLVDGMLDVSRYERGVIALEKMEVALQELVADAVAGHQPQAAARGVSLTSDLPATSLLALVDPARFQQAIRNLVENAVHVTPEGGQVTVRLTAQDGDAVVRVADGGAGIPPELHDQAFEPFFRASEGQTFGTGLGLSIAREIIELHGGAITVASEAGGGSTFSVRLPLTATGAP